MILYSFNPLVKRIINKTKPNITKSLNNTFITEKQFKLIEEQMGKPFTIPSGTFKPKQSLGQNFLNDQNYVHKIVNELVDNSTKGHRVIEIGPGTGALTRVLYTKYPKMTAIEIDQRSVAFLKEKIPLLHVIHMDALDADWSTLAAERNGKLNVIGNLPYYVVSQILFSLVDHYKAIDTGVFTMQLEVAERITASPKTKQYGIPSVIFQLYTKPKFLFKIPPTVFYPQPKVDSALVSLDFNEPNKLLQKVNGRDLRRVITTAFNQRRKMLRQSLKELLKQLNVEIPLKWASRRPDALTPEDFIYLTKDLYGECIQTPVDDKTLDLSKRETYASEMIWKRSIHVKNDHLNVDNIDNNDISL